MSPKRRGLGRGLDALLSNTAGTAEAVERGDAELQHLPLSCLSPGRFQPRDDMDEAALESLAASIRAQGVVQPIVVRATEDGHYEIIAGERRWRASQLAGLEEIPAVVQDISDEMAMAVALIENIQRENLNPIEEAAALRRLIKDCGLTHEQCAESVGRSRASVSNLLRLLELEVDVQSRLRAGEIEMGHARALLALSGKKQSTAARAVVERGLSVRQTEAMVRQMKAPEKQKTPAKTGSNRRVQSFEKDLGRKLGTRVQIKHASRGNGRVVIEYNNVDDLERIMRHVKG